MRFLRSTLGAISVLLLLGLGVGCGYVVFRVERTTRPARQDQVRVDFDSMLMRVEEVRFPSTDGLELSGWELRGDPRLPVVVLCHDNGASKSALINLAIALRKAGFNLLLFDFRGHGESAEGRSTLGLHEKRDVLGAVDFLIERDGEPNRRLGIYGVGTGAHEAVLAAQDRPNLKVLVLDRLYPDVSYPLARAVYGEWHFAARHLRFLPDGAFAVISGSSAGSQRAADVMGHLIGRDVLLLASEDEPELGEAMRRMYERIPEQVDVDGNLVFMPATHSDVLYGEQQVAYHERVTGFFLMRLAEGVEEYQAELDSEEMPPAAAGG